MIKQSVPFFSNTPDNTHCFQAALKMMLKYWYPNEDYSFEELDRITAKAPGMWTWPMAGVLWMKRKGLDIVVYEPFDYERFSEDGANYLEEEYGKEVADEQVKHCIMADEMERSRLYTQEMTLIKEIPTYQTIQNFIDDNFLVGVNVNAYALDNEPGYAGHFVVVTGYDEKHFFLNNPGLPPIENQKVLFDQFEKAWAYPNDNAKGLIAVRKIS